MNRKQSKFVVFDGIDGAGKSTQVELACQWIAGFTGRDPVRLADPGSTQLGKEMRRLLLGKHSLEISPRSEMLMFMAARAQLVDELIAPALEQDETVVCDRFGFSTVVYQGHAGGIDPSEIWRVNQIATRGLTPSLTIILDLPAEIALGRLDRSLDRLESRGLAYFERVRNGFLAEAARWPHGVQIVNATRPPAQIHDDIRRLLEPLFVEKVQ